MSDIGLSFSRMSKKKPGQLTGLHAVLRSGLYFFLSILPALIPEEYLIS